MPSEGIPCIYVRCVNLFRRLSIVHREALRTENISVEICNVKKNCEKEQKE